MGTVLYSQSCIVNVDWLNNVKPNLLVVMTMLLNKMVCLSFDEDFKQLGLTVIS